MKKVDRPARAAVEPGIEEPRRIVERRAMRKSELHLVLIDLPRADQARMLPHRHARRIGGLAPLHPFPDFGPGAQNERTGARQHPAPPIPQPRDLRIDFRRRPRHRSGRLQDGNGVERFGQFALGDLEIVVTLHVEPAFC